MTASEQTGYIEESYERDTRYLSDRITADGAGGWPVQAGRYRLVQLAVRPRQGR